jgi:hypothetical protein
MKKSWHADHVYTFSGVNTIYTVFAVTDYPPLSSSDSHGAISVLYLVVPLTVNFAVRLTPCYVHVGSYRMSAQLARNPKGRKAAAQGVMESGIAAMQRGKSPDHAHLTRT